MATYGGGQNGHQGPSEPRAYPDDIEPWRETTDPSARIHYQLVSREPDLASFLLGCIVGGIGCGLIGLILGILAHAHWW